jgi:nitroreductase
MDILTAISERRSIRKFTSSEISCEVIEKIIDSGVKAPSSKNSQPWRFYVIEGETKAELSKLLKRRYEALQKTTFLFKPIGQWTKSVSNSLRVMDQAPVTIFTFEHREKRSFFMRLSSFWQRSTYLSIGAAIENMILAALSFGLGSLWISDVMFFEKTLRKYFKTNDDIMAALSLGVPAENPMPRPRQSIQETVKYWS